MLAKISALDSDLNADHPGVEIEIPIHILYRPDTLINDGDKDEISEGLVGIATAGRLLKSMWDEYYRKHPSREVRPGTYRCTFVLEPMVVDFIRSHLSHKSMQVMHRMIDVNVRFSQVHMMLNFYENEVGQIDGLSCVFGHFIRRVFNGAGPTPISTTSDHALNESAGKAGHVQLGAVDVRFNLISEMTDAEIVLSAMVPNRTTKKYFAKIIFTRKRSTGHQ